MAGETAKGEQRAAELLEAATTVLARDGYAGTTLRRIADEAGVDKRIIRYYYGSREALLVRVVQSTGESLAANIEREIAALPPSAPASDRINAIWAGVTTEPEALRAYFALVGGAHESPEVRSALAAVRTTYLGLLRRHLARAAEPPGAAADQDIATLGVVAFAALRGLLLDWIGDDTQGEYEAGLALFVEIVDRELSAPG